MRRFFRRRQTFVGGKSPVATDARTVMFNQRRDDKVESACSNNTPNQCVEASAGGLPATTIFNIPLTVVSLAIFHPAHGWYGSETR